MDKFSKNIENIGYKFEQKISMSKKGWKKNSINDKRNNNTHAKIVLSSIYIYIYIYIYILKFCDNNNTMYTDKKYEF